MCLDSIFITGVREATENWDMVIIDLPVSFLHADLEDDDQVLMVMEGRLKELLVITEPNMYQKFVAIDNNVKKVLYMKLQKALYGLLKSALIF